MKNKFLLLLLCSLLSACALSAHVRAKKNMYAAACTKTDNHGTIDAHEAINLKNKTTFEATEYINCEDGRNLVVVTWKGASDKINAKLGGQIIVNFFSHFHAGDHIVYFAVSEECDKNIWVYKFEKYTPRRTIRSF